MAANRFDTSANQEYVSTYVPKPFELMYKLGMGMKQEHEKTQAESDALSDQINKIKVVNEVLSEGSGEDLGIKSRKIGYSDFKNEVLNKYSQESKRLADEYYATGDATKFKQGVAKQKADFANDYQKLKIAEANSAAIEEMNKKIRDNKDIGIEGNEYVLNPLAAEGRRLLDNPYSTQYQGAAIGDALKIEDEINKSAQHFADQIGRGGVRTDSHGNVIYEKTHGVTADRIKDEVYRSYDKGVGLHTEQQVLRALRNAGINPNAEKIIKVPTKFDSTGKPTEFKEVKTTEFNDRYNKAKQDYAQAVVDKAEKSVLDQTIRKDWEKARDEARAYDKQQTTPVPNALELFTPKVATPEDLNKNNTNPLFSFDSQGNTIVTPTVNTKVPEVITVDGKVLNTSGIPVKNPKAFDARTAPGITKTEAFGVTTIYKDGKAINTFGANSVPDKKIAEQKANFAREYYAATGKDAQARANATHNGVFNAREYQEQAIKDAAQNYKSGNMNVLATPVFSEEYQNELSSYLLPKSQVLTDGTVKVTSAGMLGGMDLIDNAGNSVTLKGDETMTSKLVGAKIMGPSYASPGAVRVSLADGNEVILETNSPSLQNKNKTIVKFVQEANKKIVKNIPEIEFRKAKVQIANDYNEDLKHIQSSKEPKNVKDFRMKVLFENAEKYKTYIEDGFLLDFNNELVLGEGSTKMKAVTATRPAMYVGTPNEIAGAQIVLVETPTGITEQTIPNVAARAYGENFRNILQNAASKEKVGKKSDSYLEEDDQDQ